jgi:hypothetical protein
MGSPCGEFITFRRVESSLTEVSAVFGSADTDAGED